MKKLIKNKKLISVFLLLLFLMNYPYDVKGEDSGFSLRITNPLDPTGSGEGTNDIWELIETLLKIAFNIAIPISVMVVIYAGFLYMSAGGDQQKIQRAHRVLMWALIGFAAIILAAGVPALIIDLLTS